MDTTQKRWSFIVNVLFFLIIIGFFYLFMKYALWIVMPFIIAFVVAAILQKPLKALTKSEKAPKGFIGAILSLFVFCIIIGAIALGGYKVVDAVKDLVLYFTDRCSNLAEFFEVLKETYLGFELASRLPAEANNAVINGIDAISNYIEGGELIKTLTDNLSKIAAPVGSVITKVPSVFAGLLVSIIATCFMTPSYGDIKAFILRQFPDDKKTKAVRAKKILLSSVGKMAKAYSIIILITTFELFVGLSILKLIGVNDGAHIFLISFLIALIDIVPVLGTGTVVIPWCVISFVTGNIGMGIGLLVIYAVITVIRQIIEPKLVAGQVGISPVLTIMAMFIGIKVFGALGIFILPFFVIIIKLLNDEGIIHIFNSNPDDINKFDENEKKSGSFLKSFFKKNK